MSEAPVPILPLGWLRGIAVALLAVKLALLATTPLFMDEAYYWLWGQHPDLSYFDHPPLNAWVLGASGSALGWTLAAVRVPVALTLLGDLWLLGLFARHLAPQAARETFWLSAMLFLATPIFFGLTGLALPDHLLIFFGLACLYQFTLFLDGWQRGEARLRQLYLGALALGLAGLSKYSGVLLGAGLVACIVVTPRLRPLLRSPHLYLALGLALLLQAPVLIWNIGQGFASFDFILSARHGGQSDAARWSGPVGFVLGLVGLLGPLLLLPLGRFLLARHPTPGPRLGQAVFWASTLVILAVSLRTDVLFHWNLVAYVGALPFLALCLRARWVLLGQVAYGAAAALLAFVNYSVVPVMALISYADQTTAWSYGWDQIAARVQVQAAAHRPGFIAATDYALASPLAFALRDGAVTSLARRTEQFDFWFAPAAHAGEAAILLADNWRPLDRSIAALFERVTELEAVAIDRLGKRIGVYRIYLGEGFRAPGGPIAPPAPAAPGGGR